MKERNRKILSACIAVSMLLHACFLAFLQNLSYSQSPNSPSPFRSKIEVNLQITDVINESENSMDPSLGPMPQKSPVYLSTILTPFHGIDAKDIDDTPFHLDSFLISKKIHEQKNTLPIFESINFSDLTKNLIESPLEKSSIHPLVARTEILQISKFASFVPASPLPIETLSKMEDCKIDHPEMIQQKPPQQKWGSISLANLPQIPTLSELETVNLSEHFDIDLQFTQNPDGLSYTFALTLIPRPDLNLPTLNQKILFLIDRSNSIQNTRLKLTKSAVRKAIEELPLDASFNIMAFDTKVTKSFPTYRLPNNSSISEANAFLDKIVLGNFFSPADLYKPLLLTIPGDIREDELYSAILLTDSENLRKSGTKTDILKNWTIQNKGKVSLFALGLDSDHYTKVLDAACTLNRGDFMSSTTLKGLKRRLLKLTKSIQNPIAKNITSVVISQKNKGKIQLHHHDFASPHLYSNQPYVILGTVENLDDFILFVQGRLKNQWLNIKKQISFIDARKGHAYLSTDVAIKKAYELYHQYCYDGNAQHLVEAKQIAQNNQFSCVFE